MGYFVNISIKYTNWTAVLIKLIIHYLLITEITVNSNAWWANDKLFYFFQLEHWYLFQTTLETVLTLVLQLNGPRVKV
jgi:hypothetical protein